jgi:malonyl-CoA O-methyltransferase
VTQPGIDDPFVIDRRLMRRAFDRAGPGYDRAAILQARVRVQLLDRLGMTRLEPSLVVDVGCGTGHAAGELKRRYRGATVLALDISPAMLREAARHRRWWRPFERVCADAARLPFADGSVDVLFSSLMLQWCDDLDGVLSEFRRVLRSPGLLTFTTFGPDTLRELRAAWAAVDDRTHVHRFIDMHDIGDALVRAGLAEPVLDVERFTLTYADTLSLMRDLKAIGAHNVASGRPVGLTGRGRMDAMNAAYERFRAAGQLPATYEVVYGQAWGRPKPATSNETLIPVDAIGRRSRP